MKTKLKKTYNILLRILITILTGTLFNHTSGMSDSILIGILSAATLLWIINLVIPAVIGTFFVFRLKFFRKNSQVA
jgi:hypothetical protein